jgi:hypothetical protein
MLAIASSTAWGVDRQIGVDASLKVGYSQLTGGAPSPWGVAQSVAVGFWQRSSGAAQGVGSNNIATMEYQLPEVQPTRIRSAIFQFSGRAIQCSGDEQVVVDVFAYQGDGRSDVTDSTAGTRIATLAADCRDNPAFNKPIDVTNLVRQLSVPSGCDTWVSTCARATTAVARASLPCIRQAEHRYCRPGCRSQFEHWQCTDRWMSSTGGSPNSQVDVARVVGGLASAAATAYSGVRRGATMAVTKPRPFSATRR